MLVVCLVEYLSCVYIRPYFEIDFMFAILWFFFSTVFLMSSASADERGTQYVFIIDDSGSMGLNYSGNVAADPNRLATFATQSMLLG